MTWSLIALDRRTGALGIAVATRFFAVGARVPFIAPNAGAIATQALVNPYYGIDGLRLLSDGYTPDEVLDIAGNMLTGPGVLNRTSEAYLGNAHLPLARRLVSAIRPGETAPAIAAENNR